MSLSDLWFVLFVLIIAGYLILDGFDLGVGVLHLLIARTDAERRLTLNSIGPIWDGNEVWLVVGGGVLFAAFPIVYATLFSGFYVPIMLVLLGLILRTVAIEFRSKRDGARWRAIWDAVFFGASVGLCLLLGVALGDIIRGVPVNQDGHVVVSSVVELLPRYALLVGVTTVSMLAMHGAFYLNLKTEGELQARVRRWLPRLMASFAVLAVLTAGATFAAGYAVVDVYRRIWPLVFPFAAAGAFVAAGIMFRRGREAAAFFASCAMIGLLLVSVGVGLYPNLLSSTINPAYSLTVSNAASADNTLAILLVVAVIGFPFVIAYTAGVYYIFRGKVRLSPHSY